MDVKAEVEAGSGESGKFLWKRKLEAVKGYTASTSTLDIHVESRKLECGCNFLYNICRKVIVS